MAAASKYIAKPRQNIEQIKLYGAKAFPLVKKFRKRLSERLGTDFLDALQADHDLAVTGQVKAISKKTLSKVATETEEQLRTRTHGYVSSVRALVRESAELPEVKRAWGVGTLASGSTARVAAAGEQIVERYRAHPDEARRIGVLPRDVKKIEDGVAGLLKADRHQGEAIGDRIATVRERNAAMRRALQAFARLSKAGALEFADQPEVRALFVDIAPATPPRVKAQRQARTAAKAAAKKAAAQKPAEE